MTDQRPQYGEIATLEEQRLAAGLPPIAETPVIAEAATSAAEEPAAPRRSKSIDKFVTIGLLAYGLVNVIVTGLSYLDLATQMNEAFAILGVDGEFTNYAQGKLWGTIAAIVLVAGWSLTALLSIKRLRAGKTTWWVPLVGAVVTLLAASVCVGIPLMNDPAFVDFVAKMAGQ